MSRYTEGKAAILSSLDPESEDYLEQLIRVMESFREQEEALDSFLAEHGFSGDLSSQEEKRQFLKEKMNAAGIRKPANRNHWYEKKKIGRKTAFELCFCFGLDLDETNDFFRRICLERGIDCHNIEEAVYYYAIRNHRTWPEVETLMEQVPRQPIKENVDLSSDVLYTSSIIRELNRFRKDEELVSFLNSNEALYRYNNVTARGIVRRVWGEIAGEGGLADRERRFLAGNADEVSSEKREEEFKERSVWAIYLQILHLDKKHERKMNTDRSIKPILRENRLLHRLAEQEFPDRLSIEKLLSGRNVSHESTRKTMILLLFYRFWIKRALDQQKKGQCVVFQQRKGDPERCQAVINANLMEAGYPELYYGNPYDWLFLYMMKDAYPLSLFREFISELILFKEEQAEGAETNPKTEVYKVES